MTHHSSYAFLNSTHGNDVVEKVILLGDKRKNGYDLQLSIVDHNKDQDHIHPACPTSHSGMLYPEIWGNEEGEEVNQTTR